MFIFSIFQVQSVRFKLCDNSKANKEVSTSSIHYMDTTESTNRLYMVIDTNVLLSDLKFIEDVRDSNSEIYGRPFLVIPWTVLQVKMNFSILKGN